MSRSHRKTPISGYTGSESAEKKHWHQRWRARERTALASASPQALDGYLPMLAKQVSDPWVRIKEDRAYWPAQRLREAAHDIANLEGRSPQERAALKKRLLHKWMGK